MKSKEGAMKAYRVTIETAVNGFAVDATSNDGRIYRHVFVSYADVLGFLANDLAMEKQVMGPAR